MTTTFGHAFQPVGPGPGPKNSRARPQVQVQGPQKVPGPDLDRTLDSLYMPHAVVALNTSSVPSQNMRGLQKGPRLSGQFKVLGNEFIVSFVVTYYVNIIDRICLVVS